MAYAAVHSLLHTIEDLLNSCHLHSETLRSAFRHAQSLQRKLQDLNQVVADTDEHIIIHEARKLEDAIETPLLHQPPALSFELEGHVDRFARTVEDWKEMIDQLWEKKALEMIEDDIEKLFVSEPDQEEEEEDVEMIGLRDQFLQIRDYLLTERCGERELEIGKRVVWISGMAGIGKTALAKKLFDDPFVKTNFQYLVFIKVGKNCESQARLLQNIMEKANIDEESSRQILLLRKCLIVLDDVWSETLILPLLNAAARRAEDDKGSLIMVTSRINSDYFYHFWNLKMRFMDEEESWQLLKRKVFDEAGEECPPHLAKAGKKIAKKCEGLPLLINAVAPILLSEAGKIPERWRRIADKTNPILEEASYQISETLFSSYHYLLSEENKLCFLYLVAFPQSSVIRLSRIISLCLAERFDCSRVYNLFITYNLVIGHHKNWTRDDHKSCSLHCAYWFPSKRLAENNKFLYIVNDYGCVYDLDDNVSSHRRVAVYNNVLMAMEEVHERIASFLTVRSLLCTGPYHQYQVPLCWEWKLLRILHILTIRFYEFPDEVMKLRRLRYLALTCNGDIPPSISELLKLELLIVHRHSSVRRASVESYLPVEIWDMHNLQHLETIGRNLPNPPLGKVLPNLTKLLGVGFESYTKRVLESLPKLIKLRIQTELEPGVARTVTFFDHASCSIHHLKSRLQCFIRPPPLLSISKSCLDRLSLSGFGYPWEEMSKIAEFLPQLYVLKLQCYAFRGEKWDAEDMTFKNLDYLLIDDTDLVQWTAGDETFPRLRKLTMKHCYKLHAIPPRLKLYEGMELVDCNPIAEANARENYDATSFEAQVMMNGKTPTEILESGLPPHSKWLSIFPVDIKSWVEL